MGWDGRRELTIVDRRFTISEEALVLFARNYFMNLRTALEAPVFDFKLDYGSGVITLGSCFSDVVGNYLENRKFSVKSNPFGTVYNLKSLCDVITNAVDAFCPEENRVVSRDGLFFHLDYHSEFYSETFEGLIQRIREAGRDFKAFLQEADLLILTLGTSWVYRHEGEPVSNCHKLPASRFEKHLLSLEEQRERLNFLISKVRSVNPELKIMFTVSPVRHIKEGIQENSVSKALLRLICDEAVKNYPATSYFPSFEIMMDDLRDYRFYKPDLIHPDEVAETYICELFMKSVMSEEARATSEAWHKVRMALNHRPLNPQSTSHLAFLKKLAAKIRTFETFFDVSEECEELEKRYREFT